MKFKVEKASDWGYESELTINTIDDLLEFINANGRVIIDNNRIIIYDSWVE